MSNIRLFYKTVFLLLLMILGTDHVQGKDYDLEKVRINVVVRTNGDINIEEIRSYQFDGDFSYAYRDLLKARVDRIRDIQVADESGPLRFDDSEQPGTYTIKQNSDNARITWYYDAHDEERTFTLSYTLQGALVVGPEWAEFFRIYIGDAWEVDSENVTLKIKFDEPAGAQLYSWLRTDLSKIDHRLTQDGIIYTTPLVDDDQSLGVRLVFPRASVPGAKVNDSDFSLAVAKQQEQERERQAALELKRQARYQSYAHLFTGILVLLSIALYIFFYRRFGNKPEVPDYLPINLRELTSDYTVAEIGYLRERTVSNPIIIATLFDLSRRGYFKIVENESSGWFEKVVFIVENTGTHTDTASLKPHEKLFYDFVTKRLNKGKTRLKEIFDGMGFEVSNFTSEWKKSIKQDVAVYDWFDERSYNGRFFAILLQALLLVIGISNLIWAGIAGLFGVVVPLAALLFSIGIAHRTKEGRMLYERLKAYEDQLNKGFVDFPDTSSSIHFVFAILFSLSKGRIKKLIQSMDTDAITAHWFVLLPHHANDPSHVVNSIQNLTTVATTSVSGAGGATAGAASGGGGGGAG